MKIALTEEQEQKLEEQHKTERDSRICDRIKAVLLTSEDWTQKQIAQALRIHETTVWGHLKDYLFQEKLKPISGGSSSKLNEQQTIEIISHLEQNTYPSTKEIIQYIQVRYGVSCTQQGMHDWLIKHRFSCKKPKGAPSRFNKLRQEAFIREYEESKASLEPGEVVLFIDSVHPTQATKITSGWIRKGVEKMIATVASRSRINLTGAIDLNTMPIITREYETINGSTTVDFLQTIETAHPAAAKIHIIADGGGAHTSNEVGLFLSEANAVNRLFLDETYGIELPGNSVKLPKKVKVQLKSIVEKEAQLFRDRSILDVDKLTVRELLDTVKAPPPHPKLVMHILPPYSPNLNPIERVWKVMNEHVRNNREGNKIILGRQDVTIYRVETLPDPIAFNSEITNPKPEILLKPLESPIFVKKPMPREQRDIYLFPADEEYAEFLNQNLFHKYESLYGLPYKGAPLKFDFRLEPFERLEQFKQFERLEQLKPKLVKSFKIFQNGRITGEIKGTLQPFTVSGSKELISIGLECGFGQNNSMGCGYVEINRDGQDSFD